MHNIFNTHSQQAGKISPKMDENLETLSILQRKSLSFILNGIVVIIRNWTYGAPEV